MRQGTVVSCYNHDIQVYIGILEWFDIFGGAGLQYINRGWGWGGADMLVVLMVLLEGLNLHPGHITTKIAK